MKRRTFFKKIGKGVTGIAATASLPAVIAADKFLPPRQRKPVEIKIHPHAVSRKAKKNSPYGSR